MRESSFDLKYCERCGALWFRLRESREDMCATCAEEERRMPRSFAARILPAVRRVRRGEWRAAAWEVPA